MAYRIHGFTLVEILVALTLFSLTLGMLFSGLHSSSRSWQKSEQQIEINDNFRLELAFIRKKLGQTVPLIMLDGEDNPLLFKGESETIYFISSLPSHRGGGGLHLLSLYVSRQDQSKNLSFSYQPISTDMDLNDPEDSGKLKTMTLMEDVELIKFSYFGSEDNNPDPEWSDEWIDKRRLPELVQIHIETAQTERYIPDIIVNLHVQSVRGQPQLTLYKGDASQGFDRDSLETSGQFDVNLQSRDPKFDRASQIRANPIDTDEFQIK